MINKGLFTSNTYEWETPRDFFNKLDAEFHFDLDVCATAENAKCKEYFTEEQNGLSQEWRGTCYMNPPYGKVISLWMKKAYESSLEGATVVCLVPARTDTRWWHTYVIPHAKEVRFIQGRIKFVGAKNTAPFLSAVVIYEGVKNGKED